MIIEIDEKNHLTKFDSHLWRERKRNKLKIEENFLGLAN